MYKGSDDDLRSQAQLQPLNEYATSGQSALSVGDSNLPGGEAGNVGYTVSAIEGDTSGLLIEDTSLRLGLLKTSGTLFSDSDAGAASFRKATITGDYGMLNMGANGKWSYFAANGQSAIQSLGEGKTLTDTFTVESADGTTQTVTITIAGVNDGAVITGDVSGSVTEDVASSLTATGKLSVSDPDADESVFQAGSIDGDLGTLTIDAEGNWTYAADNSQSAIQSLGEGETLTDTITVESADGTEQTVTITVTGVNDAAVITGDVSGSVTEDEASSLTATGKLSVSDPDADESVFQAGSIDGDLGTLTIDAEGNWTYAADNSQSAIQSLGEGEPLTDTITVESADGTEQTVTITVTGVNDAAVITGDVSGSVTEDAATSLTAMGKLSVSDPDADESVFQAGSIDGDLGTLTIDAEGNWIYAADNSQSAIQSLGEGETLTDTITVKSADGTEQTITITINGVKEAPVDDTPVIDTNVELSVEGTAAQSLAGFLSATDADNGAADLQYSIVSGPAYGELLLNGVAITDYTQVAFTQDDIDKGLVTFKYVPTAMTTAQALPDDSFTFTVSDGNNTTASQTFSIHNTVVQVWGTNDADDMTGLANYDDPDATYHVYGFDGNDTLRGGVNADTLDGGGGDDRFVMGANMTSADSIDGGDGVDQLNCTFNAEDPNAAHALDHVTGVERIVLGDADTTIITTNGFATNNLHSPSRLVYIHADALTAGRALHFDASVDLSDANGSGYFVTGGAGNDTMIGGAGKDNLVGNAGADSLNGGAGADTLNGGDGVDTIDYSGSDAAVNIDLRRTGAQSGGDAQGDILIGVESVIGSGHDDTIIGSNVTNYLYGMGGNDNVQGAYGDDTLDGGAGNDTLWGATGANLVLGGDGDDKLYGQGGNDTLVGGAGADLLDGGTEIDTADYSASSAAVNIDLRRTGTQSGGDAQGDILIGIESVIGSGQDDTIIGSNGADILYGMDGNDYVWAAYGNDTLDGGAGNDTVTGGRHKNLLLGGDGDDKLYGQLSDDTLAGGAGADLLDGGTETDTADYSASTAWVNVDLSLATAQMGGGDGNHALGDTLVGIENLIGSTFDDMLIGNGDANVLSGLDGKDAITAGAGDTVDGGAGLDVLYSSDATLDVAGSTTISGVELVDLTGSAASLTVSGDAILGNGVLDPMGGAMKALVVTGDAGDVVAFSGDTWTWAVAGNNQTLEGKTYTVYEGVKGDETVRLYIQTGMVGPGVGGDEAPVIAVNDGLQVVDVAAKSLTGFLSATDSDNGAADLQYSIVSGPAYGELLLNGVAITDYTKVAFTQDDIDKGLVTFKFVPKAGATAQILTDDSFTFTVSDGDNTTASQTFSIHNTVAQVWGTNGADDMTGLATYDDPDATFHVYGFDGNDTLRGGVNADTLDGGTGVDTADYSASTAAVQVNLDLATAQSGGDAEGDVLIGIENVTGSALGDSLAGNAENNVLLGLDGADTLDGGGGRDTLHGGDGDDSLYGGWGSDVLDGGIGNDSMHGGIDDSGADTMYGSSGDDTIAAGGGNDAVMGGAGADVIDGGTGIDMASYATSGSGVNVDLNRQGGGQTQSGGDAEGDVLTGIENLYGSNFNDVLTGDSGDNVLHGLSGNDTIVAGGGNDTLNGRDGADFLDGGTGVDMVSYEDSRSGVNVDLTRQGGGQTQSGGDAEGDVLTGIENLVGSNRNDVLTGDSGANALNGLQGADTIMAGAGDDTLYGGWGNNAVLDGGEGDDTADYSTCNDSVNVNLSLDMALIGGVLFNRLTSIENFTGSNFNDVLTGSNVANVLKGLRGNDTIRGGAGADVIDGGEGVDTADYSASSAAVNIDLRRTGAQSGGDAQGDILIGIEGVIGSDHNDTIIGSNGADVLYGMDGNDDVRAAYGNDTLDGGAGNDTLWGARDTNLLLGGDGNDKLYGQGNNDTLAGGAGADLLDGGTEIDTADYSSSTAWVNVDLSLATAQIGGGDGNHALGDTLIGIENLTGSNFGDVLIGNGDANVLNGLAGDDAITAGAGDTVHGGAGLDVLYSSDTTLDVAGSTTISGVELVDLTGSATSLTVSGDAILSNGAIDPLDSGRKALIVTGDAGDAVHFASDTWAWQALPDSQTLSDGKTYTVYEASNDTGTVRLYVQVGVTVESATAQGSVSVGEISGAAETQGIASGGEISGYIDESLQLKLSMNPDQGISPSGEVGNEVPVGDVLIASAEYGLELTMPFTEGPGYDDGLIDLMKSITADYSDSPASVHVDLNLQDGVTAQSGGDPGNTADGDILQSISWLVGSNFDDTLICAKNGGLTNVFGLDGNDTIFGDGGAYCLHGGTGDDVLYGGLGHSFRFLIGDAGDDILHLNLNGEDVLGGGTTILPEHIGELDGGDGFDTLVLGDHDGGGVTLDLSRLAKEGTISGIERIDITGDADDATTLTLRASDVLDTTDGTDTLWVRGDGNDTVTTTDTGWTHVGVETGADGQQYNHYSGYAGSTLVNLMIDADLANQNIVHS